MTIGTGINQTTVVCVGGPMNLKRAIADVPHFTHVPDGEDSDGSIQQVYTTGYSLHRYVYPDGSTHLFFLSDHVTREELAAANLPPQVAPDLVQLSGEGIGTAAGKVVGLVNGYMYPDGLTLCQQGELQDALEAFAKAIIAEIKREQS